MAINTVKTVIALSAVALVVSCTATMEEAPFASERIEQELTITASVEADVATRTELSQTDGSVLWTPGDAISLFYGSGSNGGSRFESTATESTDVTNFTGTIGVITGGADVAPEDTYFWGLYPYSPNASCDGSAVTMTLSSTQTAMAGTFAPGASPSIGRSQGLSMGFFNICGGVKFSVTHPGIKKVTLQSIGGELIAGTAKVGISEAGLPVVREILSGTDAISLEAPEGEYFEVGQYYYIMMFPTKFNSGFTLTLETFTETTTVEKNSVIDITRSYFGRMSNVDNGATYSQKTGNIPIPDANFKAYMVSNFDTDSDGEISYDEALLITYISVNTDTIASVHGIEYCKNLGYLLCKGTRSFNSTLGRYVINGLLSSLNVSNNTSLRCLECNYNQLTSLNVSNNTALTELDCPFNQLTSLDVSNNMALKELGCYNNQLTSLDVSNNTELRWLDCGNNPLTSLDVSNNTALSYLLCHNNQLTSLNVSNNTALTELWCNDNQLTNLDVSNNTVLIYFYCHNNQLTSLNVSNNTELRSLNSGYNPLTSLDVSNNPALIGLICSSIQLTSLDVSHNTALTSLHCNYNQLSSLDVSNNTALTSLNCVGNNLTSLDVSNNTALTGLECSKNQLTSLDVSSNTALRNLDCSPMNDNQGNNLLGALYIASGQSIPNITVNRNNNNIPAETQIVVKPAGGGNEGFGEGDL